MIKKFFLPFILILIPVVYFIAPKDDFYSELEKQIKQIDDQFSGNLGVYIKHTGNDSLIKYNADRLWYLASTVKIPVAIAILQKVEAGEISLDDKIIMKESDLVDGSGDMIWQKPGTVYTVRELLERMIRDSDSIAADMLIRLMGEDNFNEHIENHIADEGIEKITTILQVRYDAYSELHEKAADLTNLDIIELKTINPMQERLNKFVQKISVDKNQLKEKTISDAFEKYYERRLNSASLETMGLMLERLVEGEYLNNENTNHLLNFMKGIITGERRIKAGLPEGTEFAQKTGTQIRRACNMGIINPSGDEPIIIVACTEKFEELNEAESVFKKLGSFIAINWLR